MIRFTIGAVQFLEKALKRMVRLPLPVISLRRAGWQSRRRRIETLEARTLLTAVPFVEQTPIDSVDQTLGVTKIVVADLNQDGFQDLVSVSEKDNRLSYFLNDGTGSFQQQVLSRGSLGKALEVVDLDRDSFLDVLDYEKKADNTGYAIFWYSAVASESSNLPDLLFDAPTEFTDLKAADIDGDGDIDLVAALQNSSAIAWYENNGVQQFTPHVLANNEGFPSSVALGDIDGDSDVDIVYSSYGNNEVRELRNNGSSSFTKLTISNQAPGTVAVKLADLDGDGDKDIVSANQNSNSIGWYKNNGGLNFTASLVSNQAVSVTNVDVGDVDQDGKVDVVSVGFDGEVAWYQNSSNGSFSKHTLETSASESLSVAIGDFDKDSKTDIAYSARLHSEIAWLRNDGSQNFAKNWISQGEDPLHGFSWMTTGDLDQDGDEDLIASAFDSGMLVWEESIGNGQFQTQVLQAGLIHPTRVAMQDIDRDGDPDLIVTEVDFDANAGTATTKISWLENDGIEQFTLHPIDDVFYATNGEIGSDIVAGDFDLDGDVDLAMSVVAANTIQFYRNDGAQSFNESTITSTDSVYDLSSADIDGDGDLDLIAAAGPAGTLNWYQNDGTAAFTKQIIASGLTGVALVVAEDFDRDGDLDLVAHSRSTGNTWALWQSNSQFQLESFLSTPHPDFSRTLSTADFDRDGDADLLLGEAVFIYDNGKFYEDLSPGESYSVSADMDGDGDQDVVAYSPSNEAMTWTKNRTIHASSIFPVEHVIPIDGFTTFIGNPEDLDHDGDLDLVGIETYSANQTWHDQLVWWQNDGLGDFTSIAIQDLPFSNDRGPYSKATILDFDNDGDLDVVVATDIEAAMGTASNRTGKILLFNNDGTGGFAPASELFTYEDGLANDLKHADFDRDGDQDLSFVDFMGGNSMWLENRGSEAPIPHYLVHANGTYTPSSSFSVGDIDGDGDVDLIESDGTLYSNDFNSFHKGTIWLKNDGLGNFNAQPLPGDNLPRVPYIGGDNEFKLADIDNDGDLDMLAFLSWQAPSADSYRTDFFWFENLNNQTFNPRLTPLPEGADLNLLDIADIDRDGDLDLLMGGSGGIFAPDPGQWLEQVASGDFVVHPVVANGSLLPFDRARVADLDGDARLDILYESVHDNGWLQNLGGQVIVEPTALESTDASEGKNIPIFSLELQNAGNGDSWIASLALTSMQFNHNDDTPLSDTEIEAIIASISIVFDGNNNHQYDPGVDTRTEELALFHTATPGQLTAAFQNPNTLLVPDQPQTAFLLIQLQEELFDASSPSFYVSLQGHSFTAVSPIPSVFGTFFNVNAEPLTSQWTPAATAYIQPVPVNDQPVLSGPNPDIEYAEDSQPSLLFSETVLSDIDSFDFDGGSVTVTITGNMETTDELSVVKNGTGTSAVTYNNAGDLFVGGIAIGTVLGGKNGTPLTLFFNTFASLDRVQLALRSIGYSSRSNKPNVADRTIALEVNDGDGGVSDPFSKTVKVTAVNDAPLINTSLNPTFASINEDAVSPAGLPVASLLGGVTDPDGAALRGLALIDATGTSSGTWQFSLDGGTSWNDTGTVSITSALLIPSSGTQTMLRFLPGQDFYGTVQISYRAWDQTSGTTGSFVDLSASSSVGGAQAYSVNVETATLTVKPVNDAPVLNTALVPSLTAINEDATNPAGTSLSLLLAGVTDVDVGALKGMALTQVTGTTTGLWEYTTDGGASWTAIGAVSTSAALLIPNAGNLTKLRYLPNANFNGSVQIGYRAWDQTKGTAGTKVNLSAVTSVGGATAYSSDVETATLIVKPINDAPVLNNALNPTFTAINEDSANPSGDLISSLLGGSSDVDASALSGLALVQVTGIITGKWQYTLNGGTTWIDVGTVSSTSALLIPNNGTMTKLRYLPISNFNGNVQISYRAWDQSNGSAGSTVNLSNSTTIGGTTPYSANLETAILSVKPVNDAPIINLTLDPAFPAINEDAKSPSGATISSLLVGRLELDAGSLTGIALTQATGTSTGKWQYTTNGGVSWLDVGVVSATVALLIPSNGTSTKLRYVPSANFNGNVQISYRAWDQTQGTPETKVNLSSLASVGKTTAYSAEVETAGLEIRPVNDAPTLNTALNPALTAINEDVTNPSGNLITSLLVGASDIDAASLRGLALTQATGASTGKWQYTLDGGLNWVNVGSVSESAALLIPSSGTSTKLRYLPNANFNGNVQISYRAWDQSQGVRGTKVNLTGLASIGGTAAYSTDVEVATLTVRPVNDAPVLNTTLIPTFSTINEDATNPSGNAVSSFLVGASDVDAGALRGLALTQVTGVSTGKWQYTLDGGASWIDVGPVSATSALLIPSNSNSTKLRYLPNANFNGNVQISYRAWDQTNGTVGTKVNISTLASFGGTTPYSADVETATLEVKPVNDAPVLNSTLTPTFTAINEDATNPSGNAVSAFLVGASDVDTGSLRGLALTQATDASTGKWQYTVDGGNTWIDAGAVAASAALLIPSNGTLTKLRYLPNANFNGTVQISYRAWDQTRGTAGTKVNLSTSTSVGGSTPYSFDVETATLTIKSVNDAPVIGGLAGPFNYTLNASAGIAIAGAATVTDVDTPILTGGQLQVRITSGAHSGDRLYFGTGVTIDSSLNVTVAGVVIGTLTSDGVGTHDLLVTFNAAASKTLVQTLLRNVRYKTIAGATGTRTIQFTLTDGAGGSGTGNVGVVTS